jgi:uncharacterized membrane protein YjjP (DUF1212 family)/uncharacterized membrane protein YjjB (DUF3815 family)
MTLRRRLRLAAATLTTPARASSGQSDATGLAGMLGMLGAALLRSSRATSAVERILHEIGSAYGREDLRCFVLPTLVLVEDPQDQRERTSIHPVAGDPLRLDQTGAVEELVDRVMRQQPSPPEVAAALENIRTSPPRFDAAARVLGHAVLTLGFGLILDPVAEAVPMYFILGLVVGVVVVVCSRIRTLSLLLPPLTSFGITLFTGWCIAPAIGDDPVRLVAPVLVSFLPGLTLTLAAVELTSSQVVAGASRLVYGAAQLGLLAFGVFAALTFLGEHSGFPAPAQLGAWAPWAGIILTAVGYTVFSVAPRRALPWIVLALVIAYGSQLLAGALLGGELSGFVGAVVVIVIVALLRRLPTAPPAAVMLTCAYWLLVPGALGFIGLGTEAEDAPGGSAMLIQFIVSLVAIAIGMVVGAGVTHDVSVAASAWRQSKETS